MWTILKPDNIPVPNILITFWLYVRYMWMLTTFQCLYLWPQLHKLHYHGQLNCSFVLYIDQYMELIHPGVETRITVHNFLSGRYADNENDEGLSLHPAVLPPTQLSGCMVKWLEHRATCTREDHHSTTGQVVPKTWKIEPTAVVLRVKQ